MLCYMICAIGALIVALDEDKYYESNVWYTQY
jgi:hypothetical protein